MNEPGFTNNWHNPGMIALKEGRGVIREGNKFKLLDESCFSEEDAIQQRSLMDTHGIGPFEANSLNLKELTVEFKDHRGEISSISTARITIAC